MAAEDPRTEPRHRLDRPQRPLWVADLTEPLWAVLDACEAAILALEAELGGLSVANFERVKTGRAKTIAHAHAQAAARIERVKERARGRRSPRGVGLPQTDDPDASE